MSLQARIATLVLLILLLPVGLVFRFLWGGMVEAGNMWGEWLSVVIEVWQGK